MWGDFIKYEDKLHSASLMMIQDDLKEIRKLINIKSPANFMSLFYSNWFIYESIDYLDKIFEDLDIKSIIKNEIINKSNIEIGKVRHNMKLLTNSSYNKTITWLRKSSKEENDYYVSYLHFKWIEKMKLHYNMGIIYNSGNKIVTNTHINKFTFDLSSKEYYQENSLYLFAEYLGKILGILVQITGYKKTTFFNSFKQPIDLEWQYKDININKKGDFPQNIIEQNIEFYFLFLISFVNFAYYEIPKIIDLNNGFALRIQYLTAYYVDKSIEKILNQAHHKKYPDIKIFNSLESNIKGKELYSNSSIFRNSLMHYGLINKEHPSINKKYFDKNKILFGLVESNFGGMTFEDYQSKLLKQLINQSQLIEEILFTDGKRIQPY